MFFRCRNKTKNLQGQYCNGRLHIRNRWHQGAGFRYKTGRVIRAHNHAAPPGSLRDAQMSLRAQARSDNPPTTRDVVTGVRKKIPEDVRARPDAASSSSQAREYRRYMAHARHGLETIYLTSLMWIK